MTKATAERMGVNYEDFIAAGVGQIPVARTGKPEDIAHTASFLASEGAGFVSGQVIYVAGGPKTDQQRTPVPLAFWSHRHFGLIETLVLLTI